MITARSRNTKLIVSNWFWHFMSCRYLQVFTPKIIDNVTCTFLIHRDCSCFCVFKWEVVHIVKGVIGQRNCYAVVDGEVDTFIWDVYLALVHRGVVMIEKAALKDLRIFLFRNLTIVSCWYQLPFELMFLFFSCRSFGLMFGKGLGHLHLCNHEWNSTKIKMGKGVYFVTFWLAFNFLWHRKSACLVMYSTIMADRPLRLKV